MQRILREAKERAYQFLKDHRDQLEQLTAALMEREELDRDDVAKLLGPRPGVSISSSVTGPPCRNDLTSLAVACGGLGTALRSQS